MAQHLFDNYGRRVGTTKSQAEVNADNEGAAALVLVLIAAAPILFLAYVVFADLRSAYHWHPLFAGCAGIAVVALSYLLLAKSRVIRGVYFGAYTVAVAGAAFAFVHANSDDVWAVAASLVILVLGGWATKEAVTTDW